MRVLIALAIIMVAATAAAQHNHDRHHSDYLNWSSGKVSNCCNSDDCGALNDDEMRETSSGTEVLIAGQWCPVLRQHYLTRGKSPDWNSAHACVGKNPYWLDKPPCERLFCFSGKGGV